MRDAIIYKLRGNAGQAPVDTAQAAIETVAAGGVIFQTINHGAMAPCRVADSQAAVLGVTHA